MPVILQEKDLFTNLEGRLQEDYGHGFTHNRNVRRPLWGLRVKDPQFAWLSVFQDIGDGNPSQPVSIIDSSSPGGYTSEQGTHNFILQSVTESRQEKVQIIETFGDHFAFFYGQKPIILQVRGMLFNSRDFNWKNEFLANYDRFLRGTKCVENKSRVFLGWDDAIAQGYLLNVQVNYDKDMPVVVPFAFSMLLAKPPLDLSMATSAVDAPDPNDPAPSQFRTLGQSIEFLPGKVSNQWLPEYMIDNVGDTLHEQKFYRYDVDGTVEELSGSNGHTSESADSPNTADWISGRQRTNKQYFEQEKALLQTLLNTAQDQSGGDRVTVTQAFRSDPAAFPLANRNDATLRVAGSLTNGVANTAAVIPDAPDVE